MTRPSTLRSPCCLGRTPCGCVPRVITWGPISPGRAESRATIGRMAAHPDAWRRARDEVLLFSRRLQAERLVAWTAGNVSRRIDDDPGLLAMTPAAMPYDTMAASDIPIVRVDGSVVDGERPPTSELPLHTLVYQRRPEVGAIIHTHSPAAMTMAALGWDLPPILTGFVEAAGGSVVTAPYARPGTAAMADAVAAALVDRGACFLRHHGLLAVGADLGYAFRAAVVTEVTASVYLQARSLRDDVPAVPPDEVAWIAQAWRSQWSERARR
jgi:L-ribulose-5-phosphate 4-epimerase